MKIIVPCIVLGFATIGLPSSAVADGVPVDPGYKSENVALALTLGGAILPSGFLALRFAMAGDDGVSPGEVLILGAAIGIAPMAGHVYTGEWAQALFGTGIRLIGATVALGGWVAGANCDTSCSGKDGLAAIAIGLALVAGGTLYSAIDAPRSARRKNSSLRLTLSPTVVRKLSGDLALGAQAGFSF